MGRVLANVTAVALGGRGLLIEGPPGCGKSSLALMLIDRGAMLVGDDGVTVERRGDAISLSPPPNTTALLEIANVGHVAVPTTTATLALILTLDARAPRFPLELAWREIEGVAIPALPFAPGDAAQALRAEHALAIHGLPFPSSAQRATRPAP